VRPPQIELLAAFEHGISDFNAPFSNTAASTVRDRRDLKEPAG
jgi:hypothetical protein